MTIIIKPHSRLYGDVLAESIASFPLTDEKPIVKFTPPAEMQLAGIGDVVNIILDPALIKMLLGGGAVVGALVTKKAGELLVTDVYNWFKTKLFKNSCERFVKYHGDGSSGLTFNIFPDHKKYSDLLWDIKYRHKASPFDAEAFASDFRPFENIISQIMHYFEKEDGIQRISIEAYIGPGHPRRRWLLFIKTVTGKAYLFPDFASNGFVGRDASKHKELRLVEEKAILKNILKMSPPFVTDTSSRLIHWKNCEVISKKELKKEQLVVNIERGLRKGFRRCPRCFAGSAAAKSTKIDR